jgi:transketolase
VIAVGTVAGEAITAAEQLAAEGIHAEVVLAHTIKPFPIRLFDDLLSRHSTIITIEEHSRIGGFGESLLSHAGTHGIAQQIYVLGASDEFMPTVGSQRFARDYFGLNSKTIVEVARRALKQC